MEGINKALNQAIKEEVAAKLAVKSGVDLALLNKHNARSRIEDLKERARFEDECMLYL